MAGAPNPFDAVLNDTVQAMQEMDAHMATMAQGVRPFDQVQMTPQEEALIYEHPAAYFPGKTDPVTGLPLTNAQAAQMMRQQMGDAAYVDWVDTQHKAKQTAVAPPPIADIPAPTPTGGPDATAAPAPAPDVAPPPPEQMI